MGSTIALVQIRIRIQYTVDTEHWHSETLLALFKFGQNPCPCGLLRCMCYLSLRCVRSHQSNGDTVTLISPRDDSRHGTDRNHHERSPRLSPSSYVDLANAIDGRQ